MNYIIFPLCLIITMLVIAVVWLAIKYVRLKSKVKSNKKILGNILKIINSVRYGNLFDRVNEEANELIPNFSQSINSMIDSIADRESMIKEYQTELNQKIDVLTEVEQLKEDFVATLTHDLKVPIMAEKNMLTFLLDNRFGELSDCQKEAVTHLKNSNQELVELVEIILETYKLNETKIELALEPVDINELLKNTIEEMKPISDSNAITVNFFTEFYENIKIDKFYTKRVLKNLILNAISFSEPDSKIDTAVCCDDKNVYIKITNYGKGVKNDELEHIFDKYYTTAKKFRKVGTGLGLYLSNKIVKAHKGKITVESENDDWTTFAVVLAKTKD